MITITITLMTTAMIINMTMGPPNSRLWITTAIPAPAAPALPGLPS